MGRKFLLVLLLMPLAACSSLPPVQREPSACAAGESSYACQVERYHNVAE